MNKKYVFLLMIVLTLSLFLPSCGGGGSTGTSPEAKTNTTTESPTQVRQESSVTRGEVSLIDENGDLILDEGKITLLVYQGEARLSTDKGDSWREIASGQWLEAGDEIQLANNGLALIVLPEVGIIRLEGDAEYLITAFSHDGTTGDIQFASRLYEGNAIFEINPLPTANSFFSFGMITGLVQVRYDPSWKYTSDGEVLIDSQNSVISGGVITNEGEVVTHFRGPVDVFQLGLADGQYHAIKSPTFTSLGQSATVKITMPASLETEEDIEDFLPIGDYLLNQYAQQKTPLYEGYQIVGEEELENSQTIIYFNGLSEGIDNLPDLSYHSVVIKPEVTFKTGLVTILADPSNPGCEPYTGRGCSLSEGCDQISGENCGLATGCNPVTAGNCLNPGDRACSIYLQNGQMVMHAYDCSTMPCLDEGYCKKPDCFFTGSRWACEKTDCWVCVSPDPSMGPPPAGWEPCHPACCCEPGALTSKP